MILITGGAGYIGSHTVLNFITHGIKDIIIFDNLETGHFETIKELRKLADIKFEKGDLRNLDDIRQVFEKYPIEAVIHFAAFSLVGESVVEPSKYYRNNTFGTLNLLDAMVEFNCRHIVFSSTCATYGEPEYLPIDEKHPQNPINPYGTSKLMVECIMKDYDDAYGVKSIKLRYFNVAGCDTLARIGEWHDKETHVIPCILKSALSEDGRVFNIYGDDYETSDGTCIRDYVNVEDLAEAHRLAYLYLRQENISDVFNIGTEKGDSVKRVFEICEKVVGNNIPVEISERRIGDPAKLYANADKIRATMGWKPERDLVDSISAAYEWEKKLSTIIKKGV